MRTAKRTNFWQQGSVALADILANSVAVILILIVVTLSVQQENADIELEKNADVTTLLARQLATTVVYNDLPSSPPAQLHDYNSCAIPHDCNPSLYPIVEIHQNYIREYNTGLKFYRNELLKPDNAFDQLIRTFNKLERINLRVDIYDVNLYYLAIGILTEHKIRIRHWHYLGEDVKPKISAKEALAEGGHGDAEENNEISDKGGEFRENHTQGNSDLAEQQNLEETEFADASTVEALQTDPLIPPSDFQGNEQGQSDSANSNGEPGQNGDSDQSNPDIMFESLIDLFEQEGILPDGQNQSQGQGNSPKNSKRRRTMRLRIPDSQQSQLSGQTMPTPISVPPKDFNRILIAFFLDQLQLARTQRTAFIEDIGLILKKYAQNPQMIEQHPNIKLIKQLEKQLEFQQNNDDEKNNIQPIDFQSWSNANSLKLTINSPAATATLMTDNRYDNWTENLQQYKPSENNISLTLRAYPGLYRGQDLTFPKINLVLLHPQEKDFPGTQWRPVIIVDKWLENPSLGFIHSQLKDNQLILNNQVNNVQINKTILPDPPLMENTSIEQITTLMYTIAIFLLILLLSIGLFTLKKQRTI